MPRGLAQAWAPWAVIDMVSYGQLLATLALQLQAYLIHDTNDETLLLNLVRLDGILILENFACNTV
jgi:hypothetical protein